MNLEMKNQPSFGGKWNAISCQNRKRMIYVINFDLDTQFFIFPLWLFRKSIKTKQSGDEIDYIHFGKTLDF